MIQDKFSMKTKRSYYRLLVKQHGAGKVIDTLLGIIESYKLELANTQDAPRPPFLPSEPPLEAPISLRECQDSHPLPFNAF